MKNDFEPQDWYDWVFPFSREHVKKYESATQFGKLILTVFGIPLVATQTIFFHAMFWAMLPIVVITEKIENAQISQHIKEWFKNKMYKQKETP